MSDARADLALARQIAAGDDAAEVEFDRRFREQLEHIVRGAGVPPQDCEDIVQEALLSAFRQIGRGQFRGASQLGTWLYPIIKGSIADYRRKRSAERKPVGTNEGLALSEPMTAATQESRILVREAMAALPARMQIILRLHERQGLTTAQIAKRLGRSPGRVGALLAEARQRFRQAILGTEEKPPMVRLIKKDKL